MEEQIFSPLNRILDTQDIKEKVLLFLPVSDLLSQCSSNRENRQICSSRYFWVEKFRTEGLTLLETGETLQEWISIYTNSLLARDVSELYVKKSWSFSLSRVQDINLLIVGPITREQLSPYYFKNRLWTTKNYLYQKLHLVRGAERRQWREVHDSIKKENPYDVTINKSSPNFVLSHLQRVDIGPEDENYSWDHPEDNYNIETRNVLELDLSLEDIKELLYRLVYFNVELANIYIR